MIKHLILLVGCILICQSAGLIGTLFGMKNSKNWYQRINKPSFNPPNWIFAPVWTVLYILMGVSLYLVIKDGINSENVLPLAIFSVQLLLNTIWTPVFFGMKSIIGGMIIIILLWIAIIATIFSFYSLSKLAAMILIPYFLWVSFASALNYSLLKLN